MQQTLKQQESGMVLVRREEGMTHVTLNRPDKLNAFNVDLVEELLRIVRHACTDGTRLMVFQGAGRNFSAGFDLNGFEEQSEGDLVLRFIRIEQLLQEVCYAPFQTMALAHGKNFGAGVDLICSCNRRYAAAGSSFRMPGLRFGLVIGTRRFLQRVGMDRARDILAKSQLFGAEDALAMNFVHRIAESETWPALIEAAVHEIRSLSAETASSLLRVTAQDTRDADLAELVRSASAPGLKERLHVYRTQS